MNIVQGLKGLFWNCEGFGDGGKHIFVSDSIRDFHLDFIALLEIRRSNFTAPFLRNLSAGRDFTWFCLPPHGRSGGILVGVNALSLHVDNVSTGDYCVKMHMTCKADGFKWVLTAIYGAAQDTHKPAFLSELVRMCDGETQPMMIGGDFNILW
jgi:hypothetical protein